jgi:nucleotide-binding universal stress UspA family protein
MSFTFFVPLLSYPDPTPMPGLVRAFDLAATMGGEVVTLAHEVDIPVVHNFLADALINVSEMVAAAEARSHTAAEELVAEVTHRASRLRLPLTVQRCRTKLEMVPAKMATAARASDFSLIALDGRSDAQLEVAESILFASGGPVAIFPEVDAPVHLDTVAIAWDGSRAAARAVRDALPVLALAKHVAVITVSDDKAIDPIALAGVQALLRAHGIEVRDVDVTRGSTPIGDRLQQAAIAEGAGLLVMGAYGHSRVREFVLGGATRAVLGNHLLPVLMSH